MSDDPLADIHDFPRTRPRVKKLRLLLVLAGLGLLALVSTAFGMMMAVAADLDELETKADIRGGEGRNSILVDVHGRRLGILRSPDNRIIVRDDQIARVMKNAVIAIEDKRFYEHDGVDLRGVARAFVQDVLERKAVQGGSTIPQQLVKNRLQAQTERTIFQKVRESALAYHLSRKWSKDKILTEYLNSIYFGNGAYGIESAARTYFGSEPHHQDCGEDRDRPCAAELEPHEAAMLAGIIASPSGYDPVSRRQAALDRRNLVLKRMMEQGFISPAEYSELSVDAGPGRVDPPREDAETSAVPYFTTWVKQQVVDRYGARDAFTGGLKIRTTIDLDMQKAAEQTVGRWLGNPAGPTAALVAIDNETGEVRAMVGGRDYNESPFNLATQGQRQPGSAFKPFTLAAALREGIGSGSTWSSRKLEISSKRYGCDFEVNNYEDAYSGITTLARATTFSDNAVYAQVGLRVGLRKIAQTARRMGIRTPVSTNCAMTLGGLKEGVTPLDMAHAYQTIATGGELVTGSLGPKGGPVGIREVCTADEKGECSGDKDENRVRRERVLPEGVAQEIRSILSTVVTAGTAVRARLDQFAAGKTGTTENYGDAWFVGFTDELTVAVWVGYPNDLTPMTTEYAGEPVAGGTYPADIWRDFMVAATNLLEARAAREGGGDEEDRVVTTPLPAGTPTTPGSPEPAQAEPPVPTPGDARPEQPAARETEAAPEEDEAEAPPAPAPGDGGGGGSGGGGSGGDGGTGGVAPPPG